MFNKIDELLKLHPGMGALLGGLLVFLGAYLLVYSLSPGLVEKDYLPYAVTIKRTQFIIGGSVILIVGVILAFRSILSIWKQRK